MTRPTEQDYAVAEKVIRNIQDKLRKQGVSHLAVPALKETADITRNIGSIG